VSFYLKPENFADPEMSIRAAVGLPNLQPIGSSQETAATFALSLRLLAAA
jgi:hypothetical protein